jgi:hypothetical protein
MTMMMKMTEIAVKRKMMKMNMMMRRIKFLV